MAIIVKKYEFRVANLDDLVKRLEPGILVTTPGRLYVDITFDNAIVEEPAVDQALASFGLVPAPLAAGDSFLVLESPDASRWDASVSNDGAISVAKEGTTTVKPVSPSSQFAALAANASTVSAVYVDLLSLGPFVTGGGPLWVMATAGVSSLIALGTANLRITVDGVAVDAREVPFTALGATQLTVLMAKVVAAPGAHTVVLQWRIIGVLSELHCRPIANPDDESARLSVMELAF